MRTLVLTIFIFNITFGAAWSVLVLYATRRLGIGVLSVRRSFTCGELGYYPRRLAEAGFIALACANSPALMSVGGAATRVLGTNPLAFAVPGPHGPLVVDQASSQTAYVAVRGRDRLPEGWAIGPDGAPTTDPVQALAGALLPFGGHRGGNVALLVELLATLSGGAFSLDAPPFDAGSASPGIGVFVLCLSPDAFPGAARRFTDHLDRLARDHDVRLPAWPPAPLPAEVDIDDDLAARLAAAAR